MTAQQQVPSGHHRAERKPLLASHVGHRSSTCVTSSLRPAQSSRKHLVLPLMTRCRQLYSKTALVHIAAARSAVGPCVGAGCVVGRRVGGLARLEMGS